MRFRSRAAKNAIAMAAVLCAGASNAAETAILRLGALQLSYDATRWSAVRAGDGAFTMQPIGAIADELDPVDVTRVQARATDSCETLARRKLSAPMYDGNPAGVAIEIAGVKALRMTADHGCRNAMPSGVVICAPHRDKFYVLTASRPGCRSGANNLFSGIDPLHELASGIRFDP